MPWRNWHGHCIASKRIWWWARTPSHYFSKKRYVRRVYRDWQWRTRSSSSHIIHNLKPRFRNQICIWDKFPSYWGPETHHSPQKTKNKKKPTASFKEAKEENAGEIWAENCCETESGTPFLSTIFHLKFKNQWSWAEIWTKPAKKRTKYLKGTQSNLVILSIWRTKKMKAIIWAEKVENFHKQKSGNNFLIHCIAIKIGIKLTKIKTPEIPENKNEGI